MRRLLLASVALAVLICSGCGVQATEYNCGISVVTTVFPPFDFAREVAGDQAEVRMLLTPGSEAHSYEPTPQDIIDIQNCDLFIYAGGENEEWVTDMIADLEIDPERVLSMLELVEGIEEETVEGMQTGLVHSHGHGEQEDGDEHGEYDEHVWTDPMNAGIIAEAICGELCRLDTEHADEYRGRAEAYLARLSELDEEFRSVISAAPRNTLVFADRFPARYFTERYGLEYYAAFPGCSMDSEASAKTVAFLIDKVREQHIPAVFKTELSNGRLADTVAEACKVRVLTFTSCHNLTKEEFDAGESYISLMKRNLESLKEALY